MAWTSDDLAAVETAIRTIMTNGGAVELSIDGKRVRYSDLPQLVALRNQMQREVNGDTGRITKAGFRYA